MWDNEHKQKRDGSITHLQTPNIRMPQHGDYQGTIRELVNENVMQ